MSDVGEKVLDELSSIYKKYSEMTLRDEKLSALLDLLSYLKEHVLRDYDYANTLTYAWKPMEGEVYLVLDRLYLKREIRKRMDEIKAFIKASSYDLIITSIELTSDKLKEEELRNMLSKIEKARSLLGDIVLKKVETPPYLRILKKLCDYRGLKVYISFNYIIEY